MQFLLLLYENEQRWNTGYPASEMDEYRAFGKDHAKSIKGGNALQPTNTAATVRVRDGKEIATDGPFAETKEQLGGYYLIEAKDRDEAVAIAAKIPGARFGCVEVRPIMTFPKALARERRRKSGVPGLFLFALKPLVDLHLVSARQPVRLIGHSYHRHYFGEHGIGHSGLAGTGGV